MLVLSVILLIVGIIDLMALSLLYVENKNAIWPLFLGGLCSFAIVWGGGGLYSAALGYPAQSVSSCEEGVVYELLYQDFSHHDSAWVILRNIGNNETRLFSFKEPVPSGCKYFKYNSKADRLEPYKLSP